MGQIKCSYCGTRCQTEDKLDAHKEENHKPSNLFRNWDSSHADQNKRTCYDWGRD